MKVNSICILGGGTAGFSMSSILARYRELSGLNFDIKLVYSEDIGTIGVGESTILTINELFSYLGLKDADWMKECNATYKIAIKFENFNRRGGNFYYPFGGIDPRRYTPQLVQNWFLMREKFPDICSPEKAAHYFLPHAILSQKNKLTNDEDFDLDAYSAYHFDAHLLGNFLKRYSKDRGVEVINDTFNEAQLNEDGSIKSLVCEDGVYEADLFVDSTGFNSLLLGGVMKEDYISYNDTLINDRVLRLKLPYPDKERQLKNYTNCVGLNNGWIWQIPLWDYMSFGYVHSTKFATEKEIESELFDHLLGGAPQLDPSLPTEFDYDVIKFKTGRYNRGWVKNVVAVGLSYGFLEPLESLGIATTLVTCFRVIEALSKREMNITKIDRDGFNHSVGPAQIDLLKNFIEMHYYLSMRDDSEYWKYVSEEIDYNNSSWSRGHPLAGTNRYIDFLNKSWVFRNYFLSNSNAPGTLFVAAGMDYPCISTSSADAAGTSPNGVFDLKDRKLMIEQEVAVFQQFLQTISEGSESLPSTYQYLLDNIYNG